MERRGERSELGDLNRDIGENGREILALRVALQRDLLIWTLGRINEVKSITVQDAAEETQEAREAVSSPASELKAGKEPGNVQDAARKSPQAPVEPKRVQEAVESAAQETELNVREVLPEDYREQLLAIAKQEGLPFMKEYYDRKINPYINYIETSENKVLAWKFCKERVINDTIGEGLQQLKEMKNAMDKVLKTLGGSIANRKREIEPRMDAIKIAQDRDEAFKQHLQEIDELVRKSLRNSRGLGR
jgi:hypothetical protein